MIDTDPRSTEVDPAQEVYPLRVTECYRVPGVCTAFWGPEEWEAQRYTVTEPAVIETAWGPADAVGRNGAGVLLYTIRSLLPTPQP